MIDPSNPGASRLNHLGPLYVGALAELGQGRPVGILPHDAPGVALTRDLIQLILFQRAETKALVKLLSDLDLLDLEEYSQQCQDEYEWLAQGKAQDIGKRLGLDIQITDTGLKITGA